ncbi:pyridoxamine 5'-phosphate oxidase family protein [Flavivirga rizhaonensis]|uniref:Flavin mononucleotide-binding protein n=1 Tax=Flavivirga rizhaonensis TaxID=2559571 RepID=A0A4S1E184_9FLAO|nr:pyridoxamine 5'-phosphate oxidase family protein [Flavivirga rizhaonensis]TGV04356.1 flavin mononucleotide-binding protein [Flavivirga rizhaonensis]
MKDLKKYEVVYILKNNYVGNLSYLWKSKPYVVPITYYYDEAEHCILSYTGEGHKIEAMRLNNLVSIGVAQIKSVNNWQSILIHGKFEELSGTHAKQELHKFANGVKKVMFIKDNKYPDLISDFSSKTTSGRAPIVYRIKVSEMMGKCRTC